MQTYLLVHLRMAAGMVTRQSLRVGTTAVVKVIVEAGGVEAVATATTAARSRHSGKSS